MELPNTILDWINFTNNVIAFLTILPVLLNLKIYFQTKLRDYLYISIFFIFNIAAILSSTWTFRDNHLTFQFFHSLYYVAMYIILSIAVRTKWEVPPLGIRIVLNGILALPIIWLFIPPTWFINGWWIGQFLYNPIIIAINLLVAYCFWSAKLVVGLTRGAKIARTMWIVYILMDTFQNIIFYTFLVLPNVSTAEPIVDIGIIGVIININATAYAILILLLHIFWQESVLFSQEQLVRASKIYQALVPRDNIVASIGLSKINSYLLQVQSIDNISKEI